MISEIGQQTVGRWADMMARYGYDWEAYDVTTDDHYIIKTYRILGKTGQEDSWVTPETSKGSVLCQHGGGQDAWTWMGRIQNDDLPFQLQLVDAGYDVWVANSRGTGVSWGHETLDPMVDK